MGDQRCIFSFFEIIPNRIIQIQTLSDEWQTTIKLLSICKRNDSRCTVYLLNLNFTQPSDGISGVKRDITIYWFGVFIAHLRAGKVSLACWAVATLVSRPFVKQLRRAHLAKNVIYLLLRIGRPNNDHFHFPCTLFQKWNGKKWNNEKWLCIQSHKKQNPKCTQCIINEVVLLYLQHVCCNSWDGIA